MGNKIPLRGIEIISGENLYEAYAFCNVIELVDCNVLELVHNFGFLISFFIGKFIC